MKTGCILLAAGAGARFGGDKLKAQIAGRPFLEYILSVLPSGRFGRCAIVAADEELLCMAAQYGISGVINNKPEKGVSRSIRMGLEAVGTADACMFCVCDQPLLTKETICGMLDAYASGTILALSSGGRRGNPVLFPSFLFGELKSLDAGGSGKTVIDAHPDLLRLYDIPDPVQLLDIDTKEQIAGLEKLLLERSGLTAPGH